MRTVIALGALAILSSTIIACGIRKGTDHVKLMTLDPGHFHAALVQKSMYPSVDPIVHVYAPVGADLDQHLARITGFNTRADKPTHWIETVHPGPDYLERILSERPGNVVVTAGNNSHKTDYIRRCVGAGLHVLADKPMAINPAGFELLREAFISARRNDVLLYDIMTERFEIANVLQRELSQQPELFGSLQLGTPEDPAVVKSSVHHFLKEVAGKPLVRPVWFFDVKQQGEALADVGTHLVDLVQWACFPNVTLDWTKDIHVVNARRWQTTINPDEFKAITNAQSFPEFLRGDMGSDGALHPFCNGEAVYTLRGIHARISVLWNVKPPEGGKDTHYSIIKGTKAHIIIRQGAEQHYVPSLFVEAANSSVTTTEHDLRAVVARLAVRFPGIDVTPTDKGWQVTIPSSYHNGHEAHFAQVTEKFLDYLASGELPEWEVPNMIAKYYTTTEAYRLSHVTTP